MAAHFKGLGHMEQYEYREAVEAFRKVQSRARLDSRRDQPGDRTLERQRRQGRAAKKKGTDPATSNFDEALDLLAGVLERDPNNPYAHFCRGIILEQQGRISEAHQHFKKVTEIDPNDAAAWYWSGSTLPDPDNPALNPASKRKNRSHILKGARSQSVPDARDLQDGEESAFHERTAEDEAAVRTVEKDESRSPGTVARSRRPRRQGLRRDGEICERVNPFPRPEPTGEATAIPLNFEAAKPMNSSSRKASGGLNRQISPAAGGASAESAPASERPPPPSTPMATAGSTCSWPRPWSAPREFATPCS